MIAKYIVLSNIISAVSDNLLCICIQEALLLLKKIIVLLHTLSAMTAYSSAIKFTRLIPGNICVQSEGTVKHIKILVLIQYHVERIL